MRALFIYKYLTLGGVESVIRARLEGLPKQGVRAEAWFLSDGPGRASFGGVEEAIHIGGMHDLQRWLDAEAPDIVTTIDTEEVFPALAHVSGSLPVVLEVHSPYRENRVYLNWLGRTRFKAVMVPSEYQAGLVRAGTRGRTPIHVVPNPLREPFVAEPEPFAPTPPAPVMAWLGRLDALKNWEGFVAIARQLNRAGLVLEFWIVGEPHGTTTEQWFYRKTKRAQILPRLRWYRRLPHDHIPRLLDAVRDSGGVVVSTSKVESFGLSVAEAMARECAVVVPRSGPFPEFVEHGVTGRLYRPGDVRHASDEIAAILQDAQARRLCGRRAREAILARHAPDVALLRLADVLQGVVADSPRAVG